MEVKKGMKVICVDDGILPQYLFSIEKDFQQWVEKGKEYTIRHIIIQVTDDNQHICSVLLEEVHNEPIWFETLKIMHEPGFHISRFAVHATSNSVTDYKFLAN